MPPFDRLLDKLAKAHDMAGSLALDTIIIQVRLPATANRIRTLSRALSWPKVVRQVGPVEAANYVVVIVKWRGQNYEFELNDPASLEQLRHHIFSKTGVEPSHQKLLYRGQILKSVTDGGRASIRSKANFDVYRTKSNS